MRIVLGRGMFNPGYPYPRAVEHPSKRVACEPRAGSWRHWQRTAGTLGMTASGDIKTLFFGATQSTDFALDGLLLATDDGLATAVIVSLFTDARAHDDDAIPQGGSDRRGWWGDAYPVTAGDVLGSRLWLVWPGKQLADNLRRAQEFSADALQWLLDDGIASRVSVVASNPRDGVLALALEIVKPDGGLLALRFESLWRS